MTAPPLFVSDILLCPDCAKPVALDISCPACARSFQTGQTNMYNCAPSSWKLSDAYPDHLPGWRMAQERLRQWRQEAKGKQLAARGLSAQMVFSYLELAEAPTYTGLMLDVGCGDGRRRAHFPNKCYIGLDPEPCGGVPDFPHCVGVAEFLPFRDHVFDAIMCVEALDHVIDPDKALAEMLRTLIPNGSLFIFVGTAHSPKMMSAYQQRQSYFEITEDQVHMHRFSPHILNQAISPCFQRIQFIEDDGYLACLASGRTDA